MNWVERVPTVDGVDKRIIRQVPPWRLQRFPLSQSSSDQASPALLNGQNMNLL